MVIMTILFLLPLIDKQLRVLFALINLSFKWHLTEPSKVGTYIIDITTAKSSKG